MSLRPACVHSTALFQSCSPHHTHTYMYGCTDTCLNTRLLNAYFHPHFHKYCSFLCFCRCAHTHK